MSKGQPRQTLADYVAIAVSPVLIMALVGSLIFFVVEVLLGPVYPGQLLWILFFFVFAAILISRISMTGGIEDRAPLYGIILGILVLLALQRYVKYPPESSLADFSWGVNALLIAIIWWSAHCLTKDSTLIDDNQDASGAGLLAVAGLDGAAKPDEPPAEQPVAKQSKKRGRQPQGIDGWVSRYNKYREEAGKRPHAPGVWVVYYSLAALPVFGIGQSLIPPADTERRQYAFWLMGCYLASGLGLLVTTSFLNLRRYLRQRTLQMPMSITGVWLTGGAIIIALLMALGAMIPRPNAENQLVDLGELVGVKELKGSRQASSKALAKDKDGTAQENQGDGKGKTGTSRKGKKKDGNDSGGDENSGGQPSQGEGGEQSGNQGENGSGQGGLDKQGQDGAKSPPVSLPNWMPAFVSPILPVLKVIILIVVGLLITFLVLRALLRFFANFTFWAQGLLRAFQLLWEQLFGIWNGRLPEAILDGPGPPSPPPPFSSYRDPFRSGAASQMSPAELVEQAFEALQAWAFERDLTRQTGETPMEFVERLATDFAALEGPAQDLARFYAGMAYNRKAPPPASVDAVRKLWSLLHQLAERPMSAAVE